MVEVNEREDVLVIKTPLGTAQIPIDKVERVGDGPYVSVESATVLSFDKTEYYTVGQRSA